MSGGSFDYLYQRVEEMASDLRDGTPLERAFAEHLDKVAKAMHAIEWVHSGDYLPGDADEAIRAVLAPGDELATAIREAETATDVLREAIELAREQP